MLSAGGLQLGCSAGGGEKYIVERKGTTAVEGQSTEDLVKGQVVTQVVEIGELTESDGCDPVTISGARYIAWDKIYEVVDQQTAQDYLNRVPSSARPAGSWFVEVSYQVGRAPQEGIDMHFTGTLDCAAWNRTKVGYDDQSGGLTGFVEGFTGQDLTGGGVGTFLIPYFTTGDDADREYFGPDTRVSYYVTATMQCKDGTRSPLSFFEVKAPETATADASQNN